MELHLYPDGGEGWCLTWKEPLIDAAGLIRGLAGISRDAMLQKMTHEQWSEVIRTNLDSLFNMTRPVIEGMRARSFGRIISISSIRLRKRSDSLTARLDSLWAAAKIRASL